MEGYGNHIVQYAPEYSLCAGCETCSIMCGLTHEGFTGPDNARIRIDLQTRTMFHTVLACEQCEDHPCYEACPKQEEAMCIDPDTGVVYIEEEFCIGCRMCQKACKFEPSRIKMKKGDAVEGKNGKIRRPMVAVKCDLCRDNPEGPQCIKYCPVRCIGLSDDSIQVPEGTKPEYATA